jgi:hypothetical protein
LNFVYIDGTANTLVSLLDIPDMVLRLKGAQTLADGTVRASAYATDRAITEVQSRGAVVTTIFGNDEMASRTADLFPDDTGVA